VAVGSLLVLGLSLRAVLARSLYGQEHSMAHRQARTLAAQSSETLAGLLFRIDPTPSDAELQQRLIESLTTTSNGGSLPFDAVIVHDQYATSSSQEGRYSLADVPAELRARLAATKPGEPVSSYIDSPVGPGRVLVVGITITAPSHSPYGNVQAFFFYPLTFQERVLKRASEFMLIVGTGLLAVVVVIAALAMGQVLRPIRRARDVAEEIAAGNLEARIPHASASDDFGRLAESFNRMTDNLAQKIGELENVSSLQARFVSDVSHELRTPLATVRMAADYIHAARAGLPADAQRAAVLLERELERFENLLEDLLEISRFDAGVVRLEPVEVDIGHLLDEVIDALDPIAHGRKVDVALEVDRAAGAPLVPADPRRLDRVFSNLVKNAVEHTSEGAVRVSAARRGDEVVVTVEDEGEGIPPEDLPHIFERFYRADAHRARTLGGTGLGLAIALENVHLHGGSIDVSSKVGEGSVFTVVLPAARSQPPADDGEAAEPQPDPEPEVTVSGARPAHSLGGGPRSSMP
jgi:two-component system sensor histidine kinase MtrB